MIQTVLLGDITTFLARGSAPKYTDRENFYVINQKCVRDWRVSSEQARFTDTAIKKVNEDRTLKVNDILVNSTGQGTLGRVGQFYGFKKPATVDSHVTIVRANPELVDPVFLGYNLKGREKEIELLAEGSTGQTELSRLKLVTLQLELPNLETQEKIADILRTIDEKIELNRRMNETLEQMGQALFRHYFIDSPEAEKWEEGTLEDLFEITMGQSPPGSSYNEDGEGITFYQGRAEFGVRFPNKRLSTIDPKRLAKRGDVLLSVRAPVGDINQADENCCIGRGLAAISGGAGKTSFCYYTCRSIQGRLAEYNSEGTVFGAINGKQLKSLNVKLPPETIIKSFEEQAQGLDEQILNNSQQIQTLTTLRDTLLPRLISGKVRV